MYTYDLYYNLFTEMEIVFAAPNTFPYSYPKSLKILWERNKKLFGVLNSDTAETPIVEAISSAP